MSCSILITGGTGLLGAYLVRWFRQQNDVQLTATYRRGMQHIPDDIRDGITWVPLDLPDQAAVNELVKGQDWVIHNAGLISYDRKDKNQLLEVNQLGTHQMVNACEQHDVSHLVYIGSIGALGKEKNNITLTEQTPWVQSRYSTVYGLSKYLGELEIWRGIAEGLPASIVLPSVILGTGDWSRSSLQIFDRVAHQLRWYPTGQTGYVDVRDVVQFISHLLYHNITGERWLVNGSNIPYGALFKMIAQEMGIFTSLRPAPEWLARWILNMRGFISGKSHGLEVLRHVYGTFNYDASKSRTVPGFIYRPLEDSIKDIVRIYRAGKDNTHVLTWA